MKKLNSWLSSLIDSHTPDFAECLLMLGDVLPLMHQLADTEQDSIWHAEGDVAIHTDMVLSELYLLLAGEANHIHGSKRQALILGAALHDIAKPLTTKRKLIDDVDRVVAPKHEQIGASYLSLRLVDLPLEQSVIIDVLGLVGFHQIPKLLVLKDKSYSDYFQLSLDADLELLYWLEMADMKGRICDDLPLQIELLEQYRMFAEEYQLWGINDTASIVTKNVQVKSCQQQQAFLDACGVLQLANEQISMIEEAIAKNYQACQHYGHLYVMCGISGSGKSTWIERNLEDYEVISLDDIRLELNSKRECQKNRGQVLQLAKIRLKTALANKRNVVWDATNIRQDFRKIICDFSVNYGALVTVVVFQLSEKVIRRNNRSRQYAVADEVIAKQLQKFEWPWRCESHRRVIVRNDKD